MKHGKLAGAAVLLLVSAACLAGMKIYHSGWISDMHRNSVKRMESSVDLADYRSEQKNEIKSVFSKAEDSISSTEKSEDADRFARQAVASVKKVKTDAELTREEEALKAEKARLEKIRKEKERKEAERKAKQKAKKEEEKRKKEIARALAAEKAAEAARAAKAAASQKTAEPAGSSESKTSAGSTGTGSNGSESKGCVGNDAKNFY